MSATGCGITATKAEDLNSKRKVIREMRLITASVASSLRRARGQTGNYRWPLSLLPALRLEQSRHWMVAGGYRLRRECLMLLVVCPLRDITLIATGSLNLYIDDIAHRLDNIICIATSHRRVDWQ